MLDNNLLSVEVEGDGNYFYSAQSYFLYDQQSNHSWLCKSIAQHLFNYYEKNFGVKANSDFF